MTIRVMLVDDEELLRMGFRMMLSAQPDVEVVAEASNAQAALEQLSTTEVDVVLMDIRMPRMDGVEATRRIRAGGAEWPKVLILTTFDIDEYVFESLKAGASGFLLKDTPPAELVIAVRAVYSGEAMVSPSTTRRLLNRFVPLMPSRRELPPDALAVLTEREREVLIYVAQGLSNGEIAERLSLSEKTVKTHVGRILTKLGLRDRVQAVVLAYEIGLIRVHRPSF